MSPKETKMFDPADGFAPLLDPYIITDSTVVKRADRWWMYMGGKVNIKEGIHLFSASLPQDAPLSATGWTVTPDPADSTKIALLGVSEPSRDQRERWDLKGGRHCPSYVKGWDPDRASWVERIYYAGAAENFWGPYTIGYLEWDGVSGSNREDYIVHGFAESPNGRTDWTKHQIFFPPEEKIFDFCVIERNNAFEAVFSRIWLTNTAPPANTGLWWCEAKAPSSKISDWSKSVQIMTAQDRGWHSGPWKPSLQYGETDPNKMFVFFDGLYAKPEIVAFPYVFTLGCLEIERPR